jgi:hypothetical protein
MPVTAMMAGESLDYLMRSSRLARTRMYSINIPQALQMLSTVLASGWQQDRDVGGRRLHRKS